MKEKSANGVRGCIINSFISPDKVQLYFRVYHSKLDKHGHKLFTDYELNHNDLFVKIDDDSASFYNSKKRNVLDYCSWILKPSKKDKKNGRKNKKS